MKVKVRIVKWGESGLEIQVYGSTYPIKEDLKGMGYIFDKNLYSEDGTVTTEKPEVGWCKETFNLERDIRLLKNMIGADDIEIIRPPIKKENQ